jgi:hypothetical protein
MNQEPIFIVGAPRSGTTLLSALLSSHSKIACGPETQFFNKLSSQELDRAIRDNNWPKIAIKLIMSLTLSEQKVYELFKVSEKEIEEYLKDQEPSVSAMLKSLTLLHAKKENKLRWAEKTPNHLLHLQQIREFFPQAPIIRIIRDPRDSANSMTKLPWASDLPLANAYLWNDWYQSSQFFFKIDTNTLTIRYEDLVMNPQNILKSITDFIGEAYEETMLDTSKSGKTVSSKNETWKSDVSKPLDSSKLYQWKKSLSKDICDAMSFVCIDGVLAFNYELNNRPIKYIKAYPLTRSAVERGINTITELSKKGIVVVDEKNPLVREDLFLIMNINSTSKFKSLKSLVRLILTAYIRDSYSLSTYYNENDQIKSIILQYILRRYGKSISL